MSWIDRGSSWIWGTSPRAALGVALLAAVAVVAYAGFTVDDALIPVRVARQLATGHGYRFNPTGPRVDAVTPWGWAFLLVPFAGQGPFEAFAAARWIGVLSWLLAAAWLGLDVARRGGRMGVFFILAVLAPVGAWAQAGLETGLVLALATLATGRTRWGSLMGGIAAGLRPEMLPFAVTLAVGRAFGQARHRDQVLGVLSALLPFFVAATCRLLLFGQAVPLAYVAKPTLLSQGAAYAVAAFLLSGPPALCLRPGWLGLPVAERPIAAAVVIHFAAVALAGGDWMSLYRLIVPVLPATLRVASLLPIPRRRFHQWPGMVVAWMGAVWVAGTVGLPGRHVIEQRTALINAGRTALAGARSVAALDVGWVGLATDAPLFDLAGVTDPRVGYLPGGHTSKRIPNAWLSERSVDAVILLITASPPPGTPWQSWNYARTVERRIALFLQEQPCQPAMLLPLVGTSQRYVVFRCVPDP